MAMGEALAAAARYRRSLGLLAGSDLLFGLAARVGPDAGGALAVLVSLSALSPIDVGVAAMVAQWALFGWLAYLTLPDLLPPEFGTLPQPRGYRVLIVALALAVGVVVAAYAPFGGGGPIPSLTMGAFAGLGGALLLLPPAYLAAVSVHRLPPDRLARLYAATVPGGNPPASLAGTFRSVSTPWPRIAAVLVVGVLTGAFAALLGGLVGLLALFYPVPELLVVGWLAAGALGIRNRVPSGGGADLESAAFDASAHVFRSAKGMFALVLVAVSLAAAVVLFLFGVVGAVALVSVSAAVAVADASLTAVPLLDWATVVLLLCGFPLAGAVALLHWVRSLRRLPAFLHAWNERWDAVEADGDPPDASVAVPPGGLLVAMGLFNCLFLRLTAVDGRAGEVAFVVVGTVLFAGTFWSLRATRGRTPQPPLDDNLMLPMSAVLTLGGTLPSLRIFTDGAGALLGVAAGGIVFVVVFFYAPEFMLLGKRAKGWRRGIRFVPETVAAVGCLILLVVDLGRPMLRWLGGVGLLVAVGGPLVILALERRVEWVD